MGEDEARRLECHSRILSVGFVEYPESWPPEKRNSVIGGILEQQRKQIAEAFFVDVLNG